MATFLTTAEAEVISKATGAPLATPAAATLTRTSNEIERAQYAGVPCSFLADGRCTIYAFRPWACRVHFSVDQDELLCKIVPGERIEAPSYQTQSLFLIYLLAQPGNPLDIKMADIREFFPHGLRGAIK
jgi:Fe-S-cluster containining protein